MQKLDKVLKDIQELVDEKLIDDVAFAQGLICAIDMIKQGLGIKK